jgi:hypothetical protein
MTAVEREVVVESGVGTVVLDSRLTPLGAPVEWPDGQPAEARASGPT